MKPGERPHDAVRGSALAFVVLTVFIDLLGVGILLPVIPYLAGRFREDALTVGALALTFSAAQFLALPLLGAVSDRYGRRPVLLLSLFGSGVGYVLFGIAGALWVMFAARLLDGFTGGNISVAQAYIADLSRPDERAKNMGLIGAAFGLGFIFGPAAGGALSHLSLEAPAYAAAVLCFANMTFGLFFLPESLAPETRRRTPIRAGDLNAFSSIARSLRRPGLDRLMFGALAVNLAMSGLQSNFAVLTLKRYGFGPAENAILFAYLGVMAGLSQGLLVRRLVPWLGEARAMQAGLVFNAAGFAVIAYAPSPAWIYLSITLTALGNGQVIPAMTSLMTRCAPVSAQGEVLGAAQSMAGLGRIAGPFIAGWLFDHVASGAPYWFGAAVLTAGLAIVRQGSRLRE